MFYLGSQTVGESAKIYQILDDFLDIGILSVLWLVPVDGYSQYSSETDENDSHRVVLRRYLSVFRMTTFSISYNKAVRKSDHLDRVLQPESRTCIIKSISLELIKFAAATLQKSEKSLLAI